MDCEGVRELGLPGSEASEAERSAAEAHQAGCAACAADEKAVVATLSLLHLALPDIDPAPGGWSRLEARLSAPRVPAFSLWLRVAAAASVLVAAVSFLVLAALPGAESPAPVVADTGEALRWDAPYHADRYTTLTLPGTGTLKLDVDTRLRFLDPRRVRLEAGRLFAEILPDGRGFEVVAGETVARVQGTRFGVDAPGAVCVVEGLVRVSTPSGDLDVGPRQAALNGRLTELDEQLAWLSAHERPSLRLRLDPDGRTAITPGGPLKWRLILETDAVAPLLLGRPRDLSQTLALSINDVLVPLDPNGVRIVEGVSGASGKVRIDGARRCVLECAVDPGLFPDRGPARVRALFTSGAHAPDGAWVGSVRSDAVNVEVR
jgi:ferric-dicitrate binding protein FerR (iron transport regulator)